MTAAQIIDRYNDERKSTIPDDRKLKYLEEIERQIVEETVLTHELPEDLKDVDWGTYFDAWDMDAEMLVPPPWDQLYIHYLDMKAAWGQRETKNLNMATTLFNDAMISFNGWYNRNNRPLRKREPWFRHEWV